MENELISQDGSPQEKVPFLKRITKGPSFAIIAVALLVLVGVASFLTVGVVRNSDKKGENGEKGENFLANNSLVYGYWTASSSIVTGIDLSIGKVAELAKLPSNVKHIKVIDGNTLSYIDGTDANDYGKSLVLHTIGNSTKKIVYTAEDGFGIDDYVVSANGDYVAIWVVSLLKEGQDLAGGTSQVITLRLSSGESHVIFNESSANGATVHYPIAVSATGDVYMDKFKPNSGSGWGYGMSMANFSGSTKNDIDSMQNGTYSTQPIASPDSRYVAFAGYAGSDGTVVDDSFRRAIIYPNTVEYLDLTTLTRTRISTDFENALYPTVKWDTTTGKIIYSVTEKEQNNFIKSMKYAYSITSLLNQKIEEVDPKSNIGFYAFLSGNNILNADVTRDPSAVGNLGSRYVQGINKFTVSELGGAGSKEVPISQAPVQLISIQKSGFFPVIATRGKDAFDESDKQLQLQTFELKPTLAPKREEQQSRPPTVVVPNDPLPQDPPPLCRESTYPQCNALLGTNYPVGTDIGDLGDSAFSDCVWAQQQKGEASSSCMDSPLYLYGDEGSQVKVNIGTEISNSNVDIFNNEFIATIRNSGLEVSNKLVPSIDYDYRAKVARLVSPESGFVVAKNNLNNVLSEIGSEMGLNSREILDLQNSTKDIHSPFVFVSFYNHATSHAILPLSFNPKPDNYHNIVFYFKKLKSVPETMPAKPMIERLKRNGFTAIEISTVIK